jgi:sigma-B regulation protein RsbU (phosphoserine phosphatase)
MRYRVLLALSQEISRTLDLQEILDHLIAALHTVVAYDAAGVFVLNRTVPLGRDTGTDLIAGMASVGFTDRPRPHDPMLQSGRGIVGHVIRTGERVLAPDVRLDPRYIEGRAGTLSELAVPIVSNGVVIGALNVESDRLDAFTPADAGWLESFAVAAALSIEKAILHRQVLEKQRIDQQLWLAREVQSSLLPGRAPAVAGYDLAGLNLPTWEIGGDYFDYLALDDGRLGLVVADVAGKGVAAALIMATFRAALRLELRRGADVTAVVGEIDRILLESMDNSRFVTAVYGILDPPSGQFEYANCGHNPPLLLRAARGRHLLESSRPALGMRGRWAVRPGSVSLAPGDLLVLYTDGVVELSDEAEREFGVDQLESVVRAHADRPAEEIVSAVVAHTRAHARRGAGGFEDDFTLMIVKRLPE